jgi:hypothetical protein
MPKVEAYPVRKAAGFIGEVPLPSPWASLAAARRHGREGAGLPTRSANRAKIENILRKTVAKL